MPVTLHAFRRLASAPVAALVAAIALANTVSGQTDDLVFDHRTPHPKLLFTDSELYVVGESSLVCDGSAEVFPNPRGRYALIVRTDPKPQGVSFTLSPPEDAADKGTAASLLVYDSVTGRTKLIWQHQAHPGETAYVSNVNWLPGRDVALATVAVLDIPSGNGSSPGKTDFNLLQVQPEAASGTPPRVLYHSENDLDVRISPRLPLALIQESLREEVSPGAGYVFSGTAFRTVRLVNGVGAVGPKFPFGPMASGGYRWNDEGDTAYLTESVRTKPTAAAGSANLPPGKWQTQWSALNIASGKLTPLDKKPLFKEIGNAQAVSRLSVQLASESLNAALPLPPAPPAGSLAPVPPAPAIRPVAKVWPLWLRRRGAAPSTDRRPAAALIAGDADSATLLPDGSAVFYTADGALHAVPLAHYPRADVETAYRRYLQKVTMDNAKQIGLSLLQYLQDYDERFPLATDLASQIGPYMADAGILNNPETGQTGFRYLFNGEEMAKIDTPATTIAGYLSGPDGRAVLFADGHVRWEPTPTPNNR